MNLLKSNKYLWDLFTKREEYNPILLDQHQRFPYFMSKYRTIFIPEVSKFLIQNRPKIEYPNNKTFAVCLTHDIDVIYPSTRGILFETIQSLRKFQLKKMIKKILSKSIKKFNHLFNFTKIMNLEAKNGAKSTFFFLALNETDKTFNYKIENLENEIGTIHEMGWEIGLHGGYNAYIDLNRIKRQKERLEKVFNQKIIGYRNHYIKFKVPITWELLKESGFKYDTTFGYADCVGFRNGLCHPFNPYNLNTNKYIDIWEIPLTIMDSTLENYMGLNIKNAWKITKMLIDIVKKYGGVITILWHNTSMFGEKLQLYKKILQYCREENAWMTSGEEIYQWYNDHNFFEELLRD